jgi:hypothetical protein
MRTLLTTAAAVLMAAGSAGPAAAQQADNSALVTWYYRQYLGRDARPAEIQNGNAHIQRHGVLDAEAALLASEEYYKRAGGNPAGWVKNLVFDVLDRDTSVEEVGHWCFLLGGAGDRKKVALSFLEFHQEAIRKRWGQ